MSFECISCHNNVAGVDTGEPQTCGACLLVGREIVERLPAVKLCNLLNLHRQVADADRLKAERDEARQRLAEIEARITFKTYVRRELVELRPWSEDDEAIVTRGRSSRPPKVGDYIARDPKCHDMKWIVTAEEFAAEYEPKSTATIVVRPPDELAADALR